MCVVSGGAGVYARPGAAEQYPFASDRHANDVSGVLMSVHKMFTAQVQTVRGKRWVVSSKCRRAVLDCG